MKLIIEIDGKIHKELGQSNYDTIREDYLKSQGNYLVRYDNDTVYQWPENVIADLEQVVKKLSAQI